MPETSFPSPFGAILLREQKDKLTDLLWTATLSISPEEHEETPFLRETARQLEAYFAGKLRRFSIPLAPHGTSFMLQVWEALLTIPYGRTASYKDIAEAAGTPEAVCAVGMACHRNPIAIMIPCHRIIGKNGKLVGYAGGLDTKRGLLEREGVLQARLPLYSHSMRNPS